MSAVLVEYLVTDDTVVLFAVQANRERPDVHTIDITGAELRRVVAEAFGTGQRIEQAPSSLAALAPLVAPIPDIAGPGDVVWIVPAGVLHHVPLHALSVESGTLADRNPVCYTPSASVMRYCRAKFRPAQGRLVLADSDADRPLSHARDQAFALAAQDVGNVQLFTGDMVTAERLRTVAGKRLDVVHIACHGDFDQDQTNSGITMAGGDRLTASDILGMRVEANLVTLSACQSGINAQRPGNELIGLTRSLIYAGATAVLVSLWAVDEISTNILMQRFYEEINGGAGKAAALRASMLAVRGTTLAEVVQYCERAIERLGRMPTRHVGADTRTRIVEDIADARFTAGDFRAALADYEALLKATPQHSDRYPGLASAAARCRTAIRAGLPMTPGYQHRPFEDPYHWAPFVLIGDWR
jgi:CHAT domain-containing protein